MNKLVGYICRHGESLGNNMGLFRGVLDTPLTKTGISQAHKAKDFLANKKIDHIIASPLLRAFITADIISKPHNIQVYQHRALFPWSLGVFTGLDKEANKEALELFISNPEVIIPTSSTTGESLNNFLNRQLSFWTVALKMARLTGCTLFVCHNSVILSLSQLCTGKDAGIGEKDIISPGGVLEIWFDGKDYSLNPVFEEDIISSNSTIS